MGLCGEPPEATGAAAGGSPRVWLPGLTQLLQDVAQCVLQVVCKMWLRVSRLVRHVSRKGVAQLAHHVVCKQVARGVRHTTRFTLCVDDGLQSGAALCIACYARCGVCHERRRGDGWRPVRAPELEEPLGTLLNVLLAVRGMARPHASEDMVCRAPHAAHVGGHALDVPYDA